MSDNDRSVEFENRLKGLQDKVSDEKEDLLQKLKQKIKEADEALRQIKKWSIVDPRRINRCLVEFSLKEAEQIISLAHYLLSIEKTIAAIENIPEDSTEKLVILRKIKRAESAKEIEEFFAQKTVQEFFVTHGVSFQSDENSSHWRNLSKSSY